MGEWFYTSGDDRIFPKGFPVGQVRAARNGKTFKEIYVAPSGMQGGVEEVLIVVQGVHQEIPEGQIASPGYKLLSPPGRYRCRRSTGFSRSAALATDADRLRQMYKQAGEEQKHIFGEGIPGSKPPDFTKIPGIRAAIPAGNPTAPTSPGPAQPAASPNASPKPPGPTQANAAPAHHCRNRNQRPGRILGRRHRRKSAAPKSAAPAPPARSSPAPTPPNP